MANKTVEEIVEKAKSGDKSAFDLLYREYSEKLLKYVVMLGVDSYDAEDIVSESFMEAIEHIGDLKSIAFFSTWLHSIAKNKVYTMKKKEQKHARVDFSSDEGDEQNDALDVAYSETAEYNGDTIMLPEDYAENEDIKQILADTINSLNPDQRDAVYLFYYKNNSISEIAEQAGVSENTIKSRLSLARKYMERKLKALQKGGVTLCAVPIPVILNIVVSESKLKAAAPVVTTAAGGATSGAAVSAVSGKIGALIAAGIMIGGGVGIYSTLSDRSGNIHKGDIRTADSSSVMISDASSSDSRRDWDPNLIKVVDTDTVESTIAVDDASSQTDSRPTNTNQGNTRTTQPNQQAQPAQPAQQVIEYYDEGTANNAEYEGDNEEGGNTENEENENSYESNNQWTILDNIDNLNEVCYYNNYDGKGNYIWVKEVRVNPQAGTAEVDFDGHISSGTIGLDDVWLGGSIPATSSSFNNGIYTFSFNSPYLKNYSGAGISTVDFYLPGASTYLADWERIDENGVFSSKMNNGYEMQMLFIDDDNRCTIEKNTYDISFDDIGGRGNESEYVNKIINGRPDEANPHELLWTCDFKYYFADINVESGNQFFEKIDGALYYKSEYGYSLIWVPDKHYNSFKFPKNTHAYGIAQLKRIDCDSVNYNGNSWMLTEDNFKEYFQSKKIIQ